MPTGIGFFNAILGQSKTYRSGHTKSIPPGSILNKRRPAARKTFSTFVHPLPTGYAQDIHTVGGGELGEGLGEGGAQRESRMEANDLGSRGNSGGLKERPGLGCPTGWSFGGQA